MKKLLQDKKLCILAAFTAVEIIIYITFQIMRFTADDDVIWLKYIGILLCLAIAGLNCSFYSNDAKMLLGGLFFTSLSDMFILVLKNDYYLPGVCTFICVQLFYFARIYLISGKKPYISLAVRAVIVAVALIVLGVKGMLTPLTGVCAFYFPQLLCNVIDSAFLIKISKRYILFFIGLILFMGCDVCVGIYNLDLKLAENVVNTVYALIWTFYLPAQTLIVLSVRDAEYKPFFKKIKNEE